MGKQTTKAFNPAQPSWDSAAISRGADIPVDWIANLQAYSLNSNPTPTANPTLTPTLTLTLSITPTLTLTLTLPNPNQQASGTLIRAHQAAKKRQRESLDANSATLSGHDPVGPNTPQFRSTLSPRELGSSMQHLDEGSTVSYFLPCLALSFSLSLPFSLSVPLSFSFSFSF